MPLIKKKHNSRNNNVVSIWEITETIEDLFVGLHLSSDHLTYFKEIKLDSKKKEFLVIRKLLNINGLVHTSLYYNSNGKPFLNNGPMISISHANKYVVIAFSYTSNIGVDIELEKQKILKGEKYFRNIDVSLNVNSPEEKIKKLTKIWCSKEAVFKVIDFKDVSYKNDILLQEFNINSKETFAVFKREQFNIQFDYINNYQIAIAKKI
ncbi:4'-phosphopantetheinyl transferase superfamily protein [Polaribacter sp.]|nr:4'-phosphopantetheinyl transferase superfamily protein [Polaribacter sp.]